MVYYLGTDGSAPIVPWNEAEPSFYTQAIDQNLLKLVQEKLPRRHLIYLGSHQGCGCGFRTAHNGIADTSDEEAATRNDHTLLVAYLRSLLPTQTPPLIFGCWSGDEGEPVLHTRTCTVDMIESDQFIFQEREVITLSTFESRSQ